MALIAGHVLNHDCQLWRAQLETMCSFCVCTLLGLQERALCRATSCQLLEPHSMVTGKPSMDATGMTVGCRCPGSASFEAGLNMNRCCRKASSTRASSSAKCWPRQFRGPCSDTQQYEYHAVRLEPEPRCCQDEAQSSIAAIVDTSCVYIIEGEGGH